MAQTGQYFDRTECVGAGTIMTAVDCRPHAQESSKLSGEREDVLADMVSHSGGGKNRRHRNRGVGRKRGGGGNGVGGAGTAHAFPTEAAAAAAVVQHMPTPESFTTQPMPSYLPTSSLPEPVHVAHAGGIAPAPCASPELERVLQSNPRVRLVPDDGGAASVSFQSLIGSGLLGQLLASGVPLICRGTDGRCYEVPLSEIELEVPFECMQRVLRQHGKAGDATEAVLQMPAVISANPNVALPVPASQPAATAARVVRAFERPGLV
jgi:hypothetical protein